VTRLPRVSSGTLRRGLCYCQKTGGVQERWLSGSSFEEGFGTCAAFADGIARERRGRREEEEDVKAPMVILALLLCVGCASGMHYVVPLTQVTHGDRLYEETDRGAIRCFAAGDTSKCAFEDNSIRIAWWLAERYLHFSLANKTAASIKIHWDSSAYLDPDGRSHRVIGTGTGYYRKAEPQIPAVVPAGASGVESLHPDLWEFSRVWGYWHPKRLIPPPPLNATTSAERYSSAKANFGQTIQVMLALEINGEIQEYQFVFELRDFVKS
jgi:hypothetical protein